MDQGNSLLLYYAPFSHMIESEWASSASRVSSHRTFSRFRRTSRRLVSSLICLSITFLLRLVFSRNGRLESGSCFLLFSADVNTMSDMQTLWWLSRRLARFRCTRFLSSLAVRNSRLYVSVFVPYPPLPSPFAGRSDCTPKSISLR